MRSGGEDTLHVSLWADWLDSSLLAELVAAQQLSQLSPQEWPEDESPCLDLGGKTWRVNPHGINPGDSQYSYYPFVLKSEGITLALNPHKAGDGPSPNMRIEIGSLAFIAGDDLSAMWPQLIGEIQDGLRCRVTRDRIARVDAAADLPGVPVARLTQAFHDRQWISRARKAASYEHWPLAGQGDEIIAAAHYVGRAVTGFTIGRKPIMCRVYDKVAELTRDEIKHAAMIEYRWGEPTETATRVEFQLRRDALRAFIRLGFTEGIQSVDDWIKARASICEYLCDSWLRFTAEEYDSRHTERAGALHEDWEAARQAFAGWTGDKTYQVKRQEKGISIEGEQLAKQAVGCAVSVAIRCGVDLLNRADRNEQLLGYIGRVFKRTLRENEDVIWANWHDKEERQEASMPLDRFLPSYPVELESSGAGVTHPAPPSGGPPRVQPGSAGCGPRERPPKAG